MFVIQRKERCKGRKQSIKMKIKIASACVPKRLKIHMIHGLPVCSVCLPQEHAGFLKNIFQSTLE